MIGFFYGHTRPDEWMIPQDWKCKISTEQCNRIIISIFFLATMCMLAYFGLWSPFFNSHFVFSVSFNVCGDSEFQQESIASRLAFQPFSYYKYHRLKTLSTGTTAIVASITGNQWPVVLWGVIVEVTDKACQVWPCVYLRRQRYNEAASIEG
jgi:hypothetical protein